MFSYFGWFSESKGKDGEQEEGDDLRESQKFQAKPEVKDQIKEGETPKEETLGKESSFREEVTDLKTEQPLEVAFEELRRTLSQLEQKTDSKDTKDDVQRKLDDIERFLKEHGSFSLPINSSLKRGESSTEYRVPHNSPAGKEGFDSLGNLNGSRSFSQELLQTKWRLSMMSTSVSGTPQDSAQPCPSSAKEERLVPETVPSEGVLGEFMMRYQDSPSVSDVLEQVRKERRFRIALLPPPKVQFEGMAAVMNQLSERFRKQEEEKLGY